MTKYYPEVAIVILNYNTYELTLSLVKNIYNNIEYPNLQIIIVDNASTNESEKVLRREQNQYNYIFIHSTDNGGYAKGNNIGIQKAIEIGCEYILIANNDIEFINSKSLDVLVNIIRNDQEIGVITPALISKENNIDPPIYYKCPSFWDLTFGSYNFHKKRFLQNTDLNYTIYAPRGSCMLLRSVDVINIGLLDENTFLYFEEPILAERLKKINKSVYFCGEIKVIHNHGKTISSTLQKNRTLKYMLDSFEYYLQEYRNYSSIKIYICKTFRKVIFRINQILRLLP